MDFSSSVFRLGGTRKGRVFMKLMVEPVYRAAVRRRYNTMKAVWDPADRWHEHVRKEIARDVRRLNRGHPDPHALVIDVGSGGQPQAVPHRRYVQFDLAENRLRDAPMAACADAHTLPVGDAVADCVLCLGSVANYCVLAELVDELARICRPGAAMMIHVELTNSFEFLLRPMARQDAAFVTTHYQGGDERTWVYSVRYTKTLLAAAGFDILRARSFHTLSALAYRCGIPPRYAAALSIFDPILQQLRPTIEVADSVIFTCQRREAGAKKNGGFAPEPPLGAAPPAFLGSRQVTPSIASAATGSPIRKP